MSPHLDMTQDDSVGGIALLPREQMYSNCKWVSYFSNDVWEGGRRFRQHRFAVINVLIWSTEGT